MAAQSVNNVSNPEAHTGNPSSPIWLAVLTASRSRLVLIFGVLALIVVAANVKLVVAFSDELTRRELAEAATLDPEIAHNTPPEQQPVISFEGQVTILLAVIVSCLGAMLYLLVRRIILPLKAIAVAAEDMARGNLAVTAPANSHDDMGNLGEVINNLAVNFQEVLLLTGTAVGNSFATVDRIQKALEEHNPPDGHELKEQVSALKKDLEMLKSMVKDFQFYQTQFDGRKVVQRNPAEN